MLNINHCNPLGYYFCFSKYVRIDAIHNTKFTTPCAKPSHLKIYEFFISNWYVQISSSYNISPCKTLYNITKNSAAT